MSAPNPSPTPSSPSPPPPSRSSNNPSPPTPPPNNNTNNNTNNDSTSLPRSVISTPTPTPPPVSTILITSFSTSFSTSGTSTFSVLIPVVTSTITPTKPSDSSNSSNSSNSFFTPTFWGVSGAILGAIGLCVGAICFLRGRVRNKRNDRVYHPNLNNSGPPNPFSPSINNNNNNNNKIPPLNSSAYAGNVVTLVEFSDSTTSSPPPPPPPHIYTATSTTHPPTTYVMTPSHMPAFSSMTGDPFISNNLPYGPPPVTNPPYMSAGPDYGGIMHPPPPIINHHSGNGPALPPTELLDNGDGIITFAPTINRSDDNYGHNDLPPPPNGMAYRINEQTMQPELYNISDQSDPNFMNNDSNSSPPPSANANNLPGTTRRLALPSHP